MVEEIETISLKVLSPDFSGQLEGVGIGAEGIDSGRKSGVGLHALATCFSSGLSFAAGLFGLRANPSLQLVKNGVPTDPDRWRQGAMVRRRDVRAHFGR